MRSCWRLFSSFFMGMSGITDLEREGLVGFIEEGKYSYR